MQRNGKGRVWHRQIAADLPIPEEAEVKYEDTAAVCYDKCADFATAYTCVALQTSSIIILTRM